MQTTLSKELLAIALILLVSIGALRAICLDKGWACMLTREVREIKVGQMSTGPRSLLKLTILSQMGFSQMNQRTLSVSLWMEILSVGRTCEG